MNSKILFLFFFIIAGCGVKGDPIAPKSPKSPSFLDNYPDIQTEAPLEDIKKPR